MPRINQKLKKAHAEIEYSEEQIREIIKCKDDPKHFIRNYVYIKHPVRGQILFDLYDYQEEVIDNYMNNRLNILLSARQTGKTETSGAYLLWYAIFHESKNILIASNRGSNAKEIIAKIQNAYEELPEWLKPGINVNNWNKHTCEFENKSKIAAETTSENSGRGQAISLLYCDEFAFVPKHVQEEFWASILPTLSTGGDCIISSTPNGDTDKFAELWRAAELGNTVGGDDNNLVLRFHPKWIKWDMPPDRDENFKKGQLALLGERKWLQEYECMFLGGEGTLLDNRILMKREEEIIQQGKNVLFKIHGVPFFAPIKSGAMYIMAVDPSTGTGKDFSTIELLEFPSLEQVMEFRDNTTRSPEIYQIMKNVIKFLIMNECEVLFSVENNGVGEGIISLYEVDEDFPVGATMIHEEGKNRLGFTTNDSVKLKYANKLKMLIENGTLKLNSLTLIKELKNYARAGKSYAARSGSTDDCVAAYLIAIRILDDLASYNDKAYEKLYALSVSDNDEWGVEDIEIMDDDEGGDGATAILI